MEAIGNTAIEDADSEVRMHLDSRGHLLQYMGLAWHCTPMVERNIPQATRCNSLHHAQLCTNQIITKFPSNTREQIGQESMPKNATRNNMG